MNEKLFVLCEAKCFVHRCCRRFQFAEISSGRISFLRHQRKELFVHDESTEKIDSDGRGDKKIKVTLRGDWKVLPLFSIGTSITGEIESKDISLTPP